MMDLMIVVLCVPGSLLCSYILWLSADLEIERQLHEQKVRGWSLATRA